MLVIVLLELLHYKLFLFLLNNQNMIIDKIFNLSKNIFFKINLKIFFYFATLKYNPNTVKSYAVFSSITFGFTEIIYGCS